MLITIVARPREHDNLVQTSVNVEQKDLLLARKLKINISKEFRKLLKVLIGSHKKEVEIIPEIEEDFKNFIKNGVNSKVFGSVWRSMVNGRCRVLKEQKNIDISPIQYMAEIEKRIK